jgi:hypothetical protein
MSFGLSGAGEAAVRELLERVYLSLEPDVDLDELTKEIDEGLALVASFYPEAKSDTCRSAVKRQVTVWLAEMGIGPSSADGTF